MKPTQLQGGSVKIVDSTTFKISATIAAAEVTVEPGAIRCVVIWYFPMWIYLTGYIGNCMCVLDLYLA